MNEIEIRTKVIELLKKIAPETDPGTLSDTIDFRKVLEIDSFDYLQFIVAIDRELGIKTPEGDYGKITTIKELVTYILTKKK